ncbi:DUF4282 domain-containing protein [Spirillospora sp. NPDC048832]
MTTSAAAMLTPGAVLAQLARSLALRTGHPGRNKHAKIVSMGVLRSLLLDGQMRTTITPRVITWIYRGCLAAVVLAVVWWLLVGLAVLSWGGWWLWAGLLVVVAAPLVGVVALLSARVACEMAAARFRPEAATYDGRTSTEAEGPPAARVAAAAADAARSVTRSPQGGAQVAEESGSEPDPREELGPPEVPAEALGGDLAEEDGAVKPWWFAALAGGVVLVALVGLTVLVATGGGEDDESAAAPSPGPATVTVTASAPAAPPAAAPSASASASPTAPSSAARPPGPTVRWSGRVRIVGTDERDLDAVPPRLDSRGADVKSDPFEKLVKGVGRAQVALSEPGSHPDAQDCQETAAAAGSSAVGPVRAGDVVCVLTGDGRVARLMVTHATLDGVRPTITADATIWDMGATQ